jgi:hypothetical protein
MNWEEAELIASKAFDTIKNDENLWKIWNEAKTERVRELMYVYVVFQQTWDAAYSVGYDEGHENGFETAAMQNYLNSGGN